MRIINDAKYGNMSTIYYRRNNAWEFLIKASSLNKRGSVTNFEDIASTYVTPAPANYDMVDVTSTGIMYIYITGKWVPYGEFQGWSLLSIEPTLNDFNNKYKTPVKNDWVKVGTNWYLHDGNDWSNQGTYIAYNYTDILVTEVLIESDVTQISNKLKQGYTIPKDNDMVRVLTSSEATSKYYKYHAGTRSWNDMGLYSNYVEKYQNKLLNGTISIAEGIIKHDIVYKYKYIIANV